MSINKPHPWTGKHMSFRQRFWILIDRRNNGCWDWLGQIEFGYAMINNISNKKKYRVHRIMWEIINGPIPVGMVICHSCDNRSCCNPDHLFLGTNKENMEDAVNKGRAVKGSGQGSSKLKEEEVLEIVRRRINGETIMSIASSYGVNFSTVQAITSKRNWGWLTL